MARTKRRRDQEPRKSGAWITECDAMGSPLIIQSGFYAGAGATVLLWHVPTLMHLQGTVGCVLPATNAFCHALPGSRVRRHQLRRLEGRAVRRHKTQAASQRSVQFLFVLSRGDCERLNLPKDPRGRKLNSNEISSLGLPAAAAPLTCSDPERPVELVQPPLRRLYFASCAQRIADTDGCCRSAGDAWRRGGERGGRDARRGLRGEACFFLSDLILPIFCSPYLDSHANDV